ncbi:MAG: PA2779 family protein [Desulfobacterales bacterium]|nr:PA2779 family protein [Desulfobacterales bacterium]
MAALVGTETVADSARVLNAREAVRSLMAREDVQAALVRQGIDPAEAAARAEALSDAEAVRLADAAENAAGRRQHGRDHRRRDPARLHRPADHRHPRLHERLPVHQEAPLRKQGRALPGAPLFSFSEPLRKESVRFSVGAAFQPRRSRRDASPTQGHLTADTATSGVMARSETQTPKYPTPAP